MFVTSLHCGYCGVFVIRDLTLHVVIVACLSPQDRNVQLVIVVYLSHHDVNLHECNMWLVWCVGHLMTLIYMWLLGCISHIMTLT